MQRRHKIPRSLKPTETSSNAPSSRQPGKCRERSEVHTQKQSCRRRDWRQLPTGMTPQLYACMIDGGGCQGRQKERGCERKVNQISTSAIHSSHSKITTHSPSPQRMMKKSWRHRCQTVFEPLVDRPWENLADE